MARALAVYCTRSGNKRIIAEDIAAGLTSGGVEPTVVNVKTVKKWDKNGINQ